VIRHRRAQGPFHIATLAQTLAARVAAILGPVVELGLMLSAHIAALGDRIAKLERELRERAKRDERARRLMTIPGIGVIGATALEAMAPPAGTFLKP
jgi:transposase